MFRIDKSSSTSSTLYFCNGMECEGGLSGRLWSVDFDDTSFGIATTECIIECDRSRAECLNIEMRLLTELHDRTCTELFFDHSESGCEGFFAIVSHRSGELEIRICNVGVNYSDEKDC